MSFIGIDFITSNGINSLGVTESWLSAREFGYLAETNPSDFSFFQKPRLVAVAGGGVAVIHWNKILQEKCWAGLKLSQPCQ